MPRYLAIHHAPGVSQEDFQRNIPDVLLGKYATFVHTYVNLAHGTIVNIYDADSEAALTREFERIGFPVDEIQEIQFGASADDLRRMTAAAQ
ncbi:MAG: hypothetical protein JWN44_3792 [Myxococcales bacterium]|nr:hypothetical protein [Myxococcales bacterium]